MLKDQLSIQKQELKVLGKRPLQCDPEDEVAIQESVTREIKRRRKEPVNREAPVTLQERRALDRANIESLIKNHKHLLVPWQKIMTSSLETKQP